VLVNIYSFGPRTLLTRKPLLIGLGEKISGRQIISGPFLHHYHLVVERESAVNGPERLSKVGGRACHVIITLLGLLLAEKTEILYILVFN
jgi:hypothetical protein